MGILKDKSVLYVTHQVEFLPAADIILVSKILNKISAQFSVIENKWMAERTHRE